MLLLLLINNVIDNRLYGKKKCVISAQINIFVYVYLASSKNVHLNSARVIMIYKEGISDNPDEEVFFFDRLSVQYPLHNCDLAVKTCCNSVSNLEM